VVPFAILLLMVLRVTFRTLLWVWRTGDIRNYAFPLALLCLSGLVHAFFEDWLFAVGYYLSVVFWTSVFLLYDLRPMQRPQPVPVSWSPGVSRTSQLPVPADR
jgi:hypothetical protein